MAFLTKHLVIGVVALLLSLSFLGMGWWYGVDYARRSAIAYVQHSSRDFQKKLYSVNAQGDKALLPLHESIGFASAAPEREIVLVTNGVFRPSGKTIRLWLFNKVQQVQKLPRQDQKFWWIDNQGRDQGTISTAQWLVMGTPIDEQRVLFILYNLTGEKSFITTLLKLVYGFIPLMLIGILGTAWLSFRTFEKDIHQINQFLKNLRNTGGLEKLDSTFPIGKSPELKQLSQEINIMLGRLHLSFENQEDAVQNFSHAFKTPLAMAANLLDDLNDKIEDDALMEHSERMRNMAKMSETLCRIAKMGGKPIKREIIPLSKHINFWLDYHDESFEDMDITITRKLTPSCLILDFDDSTYMVISNLLANTVKYTQEGGQVGILTQKTDGGCQLVLENSPCYFVNETEKDQLGEPFFRASSAKTEKGHGLGLNYIQKALKTMGGTCRFKVKGDCFCVVLEWPVPDLYWQKADEGQAENLKQGIISGVKKMFSL